jgi:hypothetical protein
MQSPCLLTQRQCFRTFTTEYAQQSRMGYVGNWVQCSSNTLLEEQPMRRSIPTSKADGILFYRLRKFCISNGGFSYGGYALTNFGGNSGLTSAPQQTTRRTTREDRQTTRRTTRTWGGPYGLSPGGPHSTVQTRHTEARAEVQGHRATEAVATEAVVVAAERH